MTELFRGVFTIPSTPKKPNLEIDWDGLRRMVDFCVECGAHGIVWPVNASGFANQNRCHDGTKSFVGTVCSRKIPVSLGDHSTRCGCKQHPIRRGCISVWGQTMCLIPQDVEATAKDSGPNRQ
jgi:hypothetical protein